MHTPLNTQLPCASLEQVLIKDHKARQRQHTSLLMLRALLGHWPVKCVKVRLQQYQTDYRPDGKVYRQHQQHQQVVVQGLKVGKPQLTKNRNSYALMQVPL